MNLLLDVAPGPIGLEFGFGGAVVFFLAFAVVAFVSYKLLRRSVKMAVRLAIVAIILLIAVAGSIALWATSGSKAQRPVPRNSR